MAREKGPLGQKCPALRKDHRKSIRPLWNAGKETRGWNKDAKKDEKVEEAASRKVVGDGRSARENEVEKG